MRKTDSRMTTPLPVSKKTRSGLHLLLVLPVLYLFHSPKPEGRTVVTGVRPSIALSTAGTVVTVEGRNLPKRPLIMVGNTPVPRARWVDPKHLRFTLPAQMPNGTFPVKVISRNKRVAQAPGPITVMGTSTAPVIERIAPVRTRAGTWIEVKGHQFDDRVTVLAGSVPCTVQALSTRHLRVRLPMSVPAGPCSLTVTNGSGEAASASDLLSIAPR